VLLQDRVLAVAHDRVKIEVQPDLAQQPRIAQPALQRLEERDLLGAGGSVGVGLQMPGLGQRVQPAEQAKRRVVHDVLHMAAPPAAGQLERHQRQHRVDRLKL
jgi:hypothetical protein